MRTLPALHPNHIQIWAWFALSLKVGLGLGLGLGLGIGLGLGLGPSILYRRTKVPAPPGPYRRHACMEDAGFGRARALATFSRRTRLITCNVTDMGRAVN